MLQQEEQPRGGPERDDGRTVDWPMDLPIREVGSCCSVRFCSGGVLEGRPLAKDTIDASPKTVVAALNGPALGGGCEVSCKLFPSCCRIFRVVSSSRRPLQRERGRSLASRGGGELSR